MNCFHEALEGNTFYRTDRRDRRDKGHEGDELRVGF